MPKLTRNSLATALVAILGVISSLDKKEEVTTSARVQTRELQSISSSDETETFEFRKTVSVKFDFSSDAINEAFDGLLFLDWDKENVATVSLSMSGHRPDVFIRAHFTDDYSLRCIEYPDNLTQMQSDYVNLLKNLVLDYSYKTNRDDNGEYEAKIRAQNNVVTKVKTKYLHPVASGLMVKKSLHEIRLGPRLKEASGEETYELRLNESKTAEAVMTYRLQATQRRESPLINWKRELGECTNDFSPETNLVTRFSEEEFKALIGQFSSLDRGSRHEVMRTTLKGLRADPTLLTAFVEWVPSIRSDRALSALAVGILSNMGTPEAQRELVGLFKSANEKTPHLKHQVLNAFTLTQAPISSESREFLKTQIAGANPVLAEGAAYALGASIANDPESEESRQDLTFLHEGLDEAKTAKTKKIYQDALINSGSVEKI